ncbi:TPA: hypothetical protein O5S13_002738, partial [Staphylococcus aureus]|nr:hypothetical protein [Staphylococcus aureus]
MNIILDDAPKTNIPIEIKDYSSLLLCSFLYQPLFILNDGKFIENIVTDKTTDKHIILEFKEVYWSNGELLTAEDFMNTIFYILENKLYASNYLTFIEGVEEYLDEEININEIGIYIEKNSICIKNKYQGNYYKYLFSTIYFAPLKIKNGFILKNVTCGKYKMISKDNSLSLSSNVYNNKSNVEKINFWIDKDPKNNIVRFLQDNIDFTSTTLLYEEHVNGITEKEEFKSKTSNLQLRLEFRNGSVNLKKDISKHLISILTTDKYLSKDMNIILEKNIEKLIPENVYNIPKNTIKLLYADYYPNNKIAYSIFEFYKAKNLDVDLYTGNFDFFLKEYDKNKYDIVINIISPITKHLLDYFIEKISFFEKDYLDEYIIMLNKWIEGEETKRNLVEYISKYSLILEVGNLKHNYLLNDKYVNKIYIDDN